MPISAVDSINPAFQHAKQQLLKPFRFAQWWRLALVGMLAGETGSSGGCNGGSGFNWPSVPHKQGSEQFLGASLPPELASHPVLFAGLIIILVVLGLSFLLFFIYLNSVMRFILFDSIVAKECHIREGWARRSGVGLKLFVWQILLTLVSLGAFAVLIGIPLASAWALGFFTNPSEHLLPLVLGGGVVLLVFLALVVVLAVVQVMTKDFVLPQMALEDISAMEGWRRLWELLKVEKGGYGGYIGMKIVLALGASIAVGIAALIVLLVLLIPIGGAGLVAVLAGQAAGLTWNVYTIALAVVVGCVAFAVFMFLVSMISVPVIVFFPAYSIYFFAPRYAPLAAAMWPPTPELPPAPATP